jgi:hypothetical protein
MAIRWIEVSPTCRGEPSGFVQTGSFQKDLPERPAHDGRWPFGHKPRPANFRTQALIDDEGRRGVLVSCFDLVVARTTRGRRVVRRLGESAKGSVLPSPEPLRICPSCDAFEVSGGQRKPYRRKGRGARNAPQVTPTRCRNIEVENLARFAAT